MELSEIVPKNGEPRRLYCNVCEGSMDLVFEDFVEQVSGVQMSIMGLPRLRCPSCDKTYFPDSSAFAILKLHEQAVASGEPAVDVTRRKHDENFGFTDVPFLIDADDYYYIPGLPRPNSPGFLTPLFFNKGVLIKFDNSPDYTVEFASPTYGMIFTKSGSIPFGINRHGRLLMWLGDVAKLPESEQFYLRSENVASDHSIGSEFYDAQIEAKFTALSKERLAITSRSEFARAFEKRFQIKPFHLDKELVDTIAGLAPPLVDTEKERKHTFDSLNRIFVEAIDNGGMGGLVKSLGATSLGSNTLKRLQAVMETVDCTGAVAKAMSPLYVTYDLRLAYSHLTSSDSREDLLSRSITRLGLSGNPSLGQLYDALIDALKASLSTLTGML